MGDALLHQQTEINRSRAKSRAVISFLLLKRHTRQRRPLRHTACATSPASAEEAELPRLQASPANGEANIQLSLSLPRNGGGGGPLAVVGANRKDER